MTATPQHRFITPSFVFIAFSLRREITVEIGKNRKSSSPGCIWPRSVILDGSWKILFNRQRISHSPLGNSMLRMTLSTAIAVDGPVEACDVFVATIECQ